MTADRSPRAGAGLKPEHQRHILDSRPDVGWFEVHAENYMGAGGPPHHYLERVRALYPLSVHGVGLSIGSAGGLTPGHLARLKTVVERYQPFMVSEHLAWSTHDGVFLNDLLPLPYDEATLALVIRHVDEVQSVLGRRILIENPSTYLHFEGEAMEETEFLRALARRSGCGLLLDINNVVVSAVNRGFNSQAYLDAFPVEHVEEIHLAGHTVLNDGEGPLLVDTHDRAVSPEVWSLYRRTIGRLGATPTLIEWDTDVPAWPVLESEVAQAECVLRQDDASQARAA